jgi:hypothetical protein
MGNVLNDAYEQMHRLLEMNTALFDAGQSKTIFLGLSDKGIEKAISEFLKATGVQPNEIEMVVRKPLTLNFEDGAIEVTIRKKEILRNEQRRPDESPRLYAGIDGKYYQEDEFVC